MSYHLVLKSVAIHSNTDHKNEQFHCSVRSKTSYMETTFFSIGKGPTAILFLQGSRR